MGIEYECKFQATPQILEMIAGEYAQQGTVIKMETTYYDTPSEALSARHYTLRKRLENGVSVCTLKAPARQGRGEWETECERIEAAVPKLMELGCPPDLLALTMEGLIPVCGARFTRIAKTITLPQGVVELALDEGYLFSGQRKEPLCEVEVELKAGTTELCDAFAKDLAKQFGLKPQKSSKFRRALALYKGE